jgi:hypothetical protein
VSQRRPRALHRRYGRAGAKKRRTSEEVWNAKESPKLAKLVGDFVLAHGGAPQGEHLRDSWTMPTRYGSLRVSVHTPIEGGLSHGNAWSVFMAFEGAPPRLSGVNEYSGKWNLHLTSDDRVTAAQTFAAWKHKIQGVLA